MNVHELERELHTTGAHRSDTVVALDTEHGIAGDVVRVHRAGGTLSLELDVSLYADEGDLPGCDERHVDDLNIVDLALELVEELGRASRPAGTTPLELADLSELAAELYARLLEGGR